MDNELKIKIFVDGHVLDEANQGTATYIRGIYSSLAKMDYPFEIYLGVSNRRIYEYEPELSKYCNIVYYSSRNRYVRLLYDIPNIIRKNKIQYAHFQYFTPLIKNCRWIVTVHDLLFNDFQKDFPILYRLSRNILFYLSLKTSDIKTTISQYSKNTIMKYFRIKNSEIHILPCCVDSIYFDKYDKNEIKRKLKKAYNIEKYILYVSRIEPRKNHLILVKAFFELGLEKEGYKLVLVGKKCIHVSELENYLDEIAKEKKIALLRLENVKYNEIIDLYRGADLFVYPSRGEGFGIPPLEATATGIPTLCARSTAMTDFKFLNEHFFDPSNINELKNKIKKCLFKEGTNYLEERRKYVKEMYNWDKSAKILAEILMNDHRNRRPKTRK